MVALDQRSVDEGYTDSRANAPPIRPGMGGRSGPLAQDSLQLLGKLGDAFRRDATLVGQ